MSCEKKEAELLNTHIDSSDNMNEAGDNTQGKISDNVDTDLKNTNSEHVTDGEHSEVKRDDQDRLQSTNIVSDSQIGNNADSNLISVTTASGTDSDITTSATGPVTVTDHINTPSSGDTKNTGSCEPETGAEQLEDTHDGDGGGDSTEQLSDSSENSECEYESAEEGEEINIDTENLREMEQKLTDEQKQEKREEAQEFKESGNELFRNGSYKSAINAYSRALRTCPLKFEKERAIMYSNRAACKMRMEENEGCIRDCSKALELNPDYLKAVMRRAELYEKTDKLDEALTDYKKILELDPSQHSARAACMRLPDQINERNEKMKEEMMGKLKDLGNLCLRPFGLSTNNFQLNQDPNSGGYSVNFVQNPQQNS